VRTQSGAAQGLAVLAPLRGTFTSFLCLTDRRGWHILCRPAFRPRPVGSPGRLILFSAADCLPLIGPSLLCNFSACCYKGHDGEGLRAAAAKGLSAALRRDVGTELHAGKRGEFGAGQGGPIPERFVGTTSKPKVPRERREDGPAAAAVRRPALRHACPKKSCHV